MLSLRALPELRMLLHLGTPNTILHLADMLFRPRLPVAGPSYLQVGLTSHCNLRCRICANSRLKRREHLPARIFLEAMWGTPTARIIVLSGLGEALLHPELEAILRECRAAGRFVHLTTNLNTRRGDRLEELLDYGIDLVDVSVDGLRERYERLRGGASWELLVDNLRRIARVISERRLATTLRARVVVCEETVPEIDRLVVELVRLGVDVVELSPLAGRPVSVGAASAIDRQRLLARFRTVTAPRVQARKLGARLPVSRCPYPYRGLYLAESGAYLPCCWQLHDERYEETIWERIPFGSAPHLSPLEAWRSPQLQRLRSEMGAGRTPSFCLGCALFGD